MNRFACLSPGSGSLALADNLHVPFIQESSPGQGNRQGNTREADVIIRLGSETLKSPAPGNPPEQRQTVRAQVNTGAFIDQCSTLLDTATP